MGINSMGEGWKGFDWEWEKGDEATKLDFIDRATQLSPARGIVPILTGIDSFHFSVRNRAREGLEALKSKAIALQNLRHTDPTCDPLDFIHESSVFSAKIYALLKPDLPIQEIRLYMTTLLESGGRGPFYAWRFYQSGTISTHTLKNVVATISESGRLALVIQYLKSSPVVRRHYAREFKLILRGVTSRKEVIGFLASLFDKNKIYDPFLTNLNPDLRDSKTLISTELAPDPPVYNPHHRAQAVKALAMIVPRISPDLILSLLSSKEDRIVHAAVLAVIEASAKKTYADIFKPLLERVCTEDDEDPSGFRALVMSTPFSLLELVNSIKNRNPHFMGPVFDELAKLSNISFMFIQEIVMDKDSWLKTNPEIFRALVYGMIKKRPERVIKLIESCDHGPDPTVQKRAVTLTRTIEEALSKEKKSITAHGAKLKVKLKSIAMPEERQNILTKLFTGSLQKQLLNIMEGRTTDRVDFSGKNLSNIDLGSGKFFSPTVFDCCRIHKSNFSFASFINSSFQAVTLDRVNLNGATFDSICFDNSVFLNVSAKGAVFINCSFEKASFFGASFESAQMINCIFTGADISTSLFLKADLSGSSFAGTRTANVSFAESILVDSDFSGLQARFTRFPPHTVSTLETDDANFNARMFLFDQGELPGKLFDVQKNKSNQGHDFIQEMALLILTDLLHRGVNLFLNQNKFSLLTAMDIFKPKQADLFEIVPLLVHENINFPGYNADLEKAPCGIANYRPCLQTGATAMLHLSPKSIKYRFSSSPHVEGLFTMGSTGTIAQAPDSDIDYWVCVHNHDPQSPEGELFQKKLTRIEQWALDGFKTEIHFFIVDIDRARNDDFGGSTGESSGSAQGLILKEEFYRTMILVAGKLPFWCTLPVSISRAYYGRLLSRICINPVQCRFIDLGDIHEIPSEEYFGASIWQLFKLLKSPFKSVIKMALLEEFIHASGKKQLLCNRFKEQWMNPGPYSTLGKIDPYYTLIKSLVDYYGQEKNPDAAQLVQECFFFKTGIVDDSDLDRTLFGFRSLFITRCMAQWNWTRDMVFESGNFRQWHYGDITRLSRKIQQYMVKTYIRVNQTMNKGTGAMITPEDRTVLGRKMFVEFSSQPEKITKTLLVSRSDRHFTGLTLKYVVKPGHPNQWILVNRAARLKFESEEVISQGKTIEEIAAWFIQNQLFSTSTIINLFPNPTPVSSDDIQRLFHALYLFFVNDNNESISSKNLLSSPEVKAVFISLNLCVPRKKKRVHEFSAIYLNSWGEMFCVQRSSEQGFLTENEILEQLRIMLKLERLPQRMLFHYPRTFHL